MLGVGIVLAIAMLGALAQYHRPVELAVIAVCTLVLVILPLVAAWRLFRRHVYVDPAGVTVVVGAKQRRIAYAELDQILPRTDETSVKMLDTRTVSLILQATSPDGRRTRVQLSPQDLETIDPVLLALEPEVARRPDLLPNDYARNQFAWSVTRAHERIGTA